MTLYRPDDDPLSGYDQPRGRVARGPAGGGSRGSSGGGSGLDPLTRRRLLGALAAAAGVVLIVIAVLAMTGILGRSSGKADSAQDGGLGPSGSGQSAASSSAAGSTSAAASSTGAPTSKAPPADPNAKASLTVLNNSATGGLAGQAATAFTSDGWTVSQTGNYTGSVPGDTIYYTDGNAAEQAAAQNLQTQFPQLSNLAPAPAGFPYSGVVVVLTGDWKP